MIYKILYYIIGAIPIVFIYAYFKIFYAPPSDITTGTINSNTLEKVYSIDRYIIITKYLFGTLIIQFPLLLILPFTVLTLIHKSFFSWRNIIIISTLAVYLFVYIITPYDIEWHLSRSLSRLIHQLYPSCIYSCLLLIEEYYLRPTRNISKPDVCG